MCLITVNLSMPCIVLSVLVLFLYSVEFFLFDVSEIKFK